MARNPRRTRAGVAGPGRQGCCQGSRSSAAVRRASQSWAKAARTSQVQRSAAAGSRSFGRVQPRACLRNLNVCSRSKRRRIACQHRSASAGPASGREVHSHTGLRRAVMGQVIDGEPDDSALDDRECPLVAFPSAAGLQLRVRPVPMRGRSRPRTGWSRWWWRRPVPAGRRPRRAAAPRRVLHRHRPDPAWARRGGGGRRNTRLVPSRPVTCTGRSRSSQAGHGPARIRRRRSP